MLSALLGIPLAELEELIVSAILISDRRDLLGALAEPERVELAIASLEALPREWAFELCREAVRNEIRAGQ